MINWENAADDDYGISAASNNSAEPTFSITINSNTHPMLSGLPTGPVVITYGDQALSYALPKNPVNTFATYTSDATKSAWAMWEIGDDLDPALSTKAGFPADAKAVGRRCHVPFQNPTFTKITPEGLTVFLNSVDYMIDKKMDAIVPVVQLKFDADSVKMNAGDKVDKSAIIFPSNAIDKTLTWASSNTAVATVSSTGSITAVSGGTAIITTTSNGVSAKIVAVVTGASTVDVTGVTLDTTTKSLANKTTFTLVATVAPAGATNKTITWTTSDATVATVSAAGLVTAIKVGTATITATSNNSKTATCVVTVTPGVGNPEISLSNCIVYPNPVQNLLNINADNIKSVAIYNALGSQVLKSDRGFERGINVSGLKAGIYFVNISTSKGISKTKFIKN